MAESSDVKNQIIKCEFCGFTFQKCDGISCDSCPINCKTVKCPNCGYEILPESKSYKFYFLSPGNYDFEILYLMNY